MRPSHRLDLLLVPSLDHPQPERALQRMWTNLVERGVVDPDGGAGVHEGRWVGGGFRRMRLDTPGSLTVYGNRQGGFRAYCPVTPTNVTHAFVERVTEARNGSSWTLPCPACGAEHRLDELVGRPPFAIGRAALITSDVESASLTPEASDWVKEWDVSHTVVLTRG